MIFADGVERPRKPHHLAVARHARTRHATSPPPASRSRRSSPIAAERVARELAEAATRRVPRRAVARRSSRTTRGVTRSATSSAAAWSRSSTRGSAGSTPPHRGWPRSDAMPMPALAARGGTVCISPERSGRCATTPACSPRRNARPTTTACAWSRSPSTPKRYGFELRRMPRREYDALVEDLAFNAMLAAANAALARITAELGEELPSELVARWPARATRSRRCGTSRPASTAHAHAVTGELLVQPIDRDAPARCGPAPRSRPRGTPDRAAHAARRFWPEYPVPSVPVRATAVPGVPLLEGPDLGEHELGDRRGPRNAGADGIDGAAELADRLRDRTLEMVAALGVLGVLLGPHRRRATAPTTSRGRPPSPSTSPCASLRRKTNCVTVPLMKVRARFPQDS